MFVPLCLPSISVACRWVLLVVFCAVLGLVDGALEGETPRVTDVKSAGQRWQFHAPRPIWACIITPPPDPRWPYRFAELAAVRH